MRSLLDEASVFCQTYGSPEEISRYPVAALVLRLAAALKQATPTLDEREALQLAGNLQISCSSAHIIRKFLERTND